MIEQEGNAAVGIWNALLLVAPFFAFVAGVVVGWWLL